MNHAGENPPDAKPLEARLLVSIGLNGLIVIAEVLGGLISGSLALLSDAMHNVSDVAALLIALVARRLGRRPPSHRHTYGLGRIEVMAALFSSATILVVGTLIMRAAIIRLFNPTPVLGGIMLTVAVVGLAANLISVLLLKGHSHGDLDMRAAVLHLLQDTVSSVAVVLAALLARWRYGVYLDPAVSILVVGLVLLSGWRLLRDAIRGLLEGTPEGLDLEELRKDIQELVPGADLHHVHVWELRPDQRILTAHLRMPDDELLSKHEVVIQQVRQRLKCRWDIAHSTLEPEFAGCGENHLLGGRRKGARDEKIQILGTGWPKCKLLAANVEAAVKTLRMEADIEKVEKIAEIMKFGVMTTPALVVDGVVKSAGKVLSAEQVADLLK